MLARPDVLGRVARWITEQLAFLAVLAVLAGAFSYLLAAPAHWRRGTIVIASALLLAGVLRAGAADVLGGHAPRPAPRARRRGLPMLGGVILGVDIRLHN